MEEKKEIRCCIPVPKIENDGYDWWERHEKKCTLVRDSFFSFYIWFACAHTYQLAKIRKKNHIFNKF